MIPNYDEHHTQGGTHVHFTAIPSLFGIFSAKERRDCIGYLLPHADNKASNHPCYLSGVHEQVARQLGEMSEAIDTFPMSYDKPQGALAPQSLLGKLQALGATNTELVAVNQACGDFMAAVTKVLRENPLDPPKQS